MFKDVCFDLNWKKLFSQAKWVNAALKDNLQINGQKAMDEMKLSSYKINACLQEHISIGLISNIIVPNLFHPKRVGIAYIFLGILLTHQNILSIFKVV